jgi:lysophospholipase L1-like esterase
MPVGMRAAPSGTVNRYLMICLLIAFSCGDASAMIANGTPWTGVTRFEIRPGDRIAIAGDSISVSGNPDGWAEEVINEAQMLYGDGVTWFNHGAPGQNLFSYMSGGYHIPIVADAPTAIIMELGTNYPYDGITQEASTTQALALIDYWRANIPGVRILVVGMWNWGSELTADMNPSYLLDTCAALAAAAAARGLPYVDVHQRYIRAQAQYNPPPGVHDGITTLDGLHPNWRGRQFYGVEVRRNIKFINPTYAMPDFATWQPDADVTPALWLEADQLALADGAAVSTFGPWSAAGARRPAYQATGWDGDKPAVYFDGTNVMTAAGLSIPSGAKTIFAMYKSDAFPSAFLDWQNLASFKIGPNLFSRITAADQWFTTKSFSFDGDVVGGPQNTGTERDDPSIPTPTVVLTNSFYNEATTFPVRVASSWNGGAIDSTASYSAYMGGGRPGVLQGQPWGRFIPSPTTITSLGARLDDGSTIDKAFAGKLAALIVHPGVLTTVQRARVLTYLGRKWGPQ